MSFISDNFRHVTFSERLFSRAKTAREIFSTLPRLAGGVLLLRLLTVAALSHRPTVGRFDITGAQAAPLWTFYPRKRLPQLPVRDNYAHGGVASTLRSPLATTIVLQMNWNCCRGTPSDRSLDPGGGSAGSRRESLDRPLALLFAFRRPMDCGTQAVLSAVLAMVGPGTWPIDARLFGRFRIDMP